MVDKRRHRGAHPGDRDAFGEAALPQLRAAVADLAWLLSRGYAQNSATKLVGDRYSLVERQRIAVKRCTCPDESLKDRINRRIEAGTGRLETVWIDGYNILTTVEAALAGGVILVGRDGCYRDMASMHGSFRSVEETRPALELIGRTLAKTAKHARWFLDQPVSNSGRLKQMMQEISASNSWGWEVELVPDPDSLLRQRETVVVSADSGVLDHCGPWLNLSKEVILTEVAQAWLVDLRG